MQSHIHNCHGAVPAVFNFMPGKGNASSQAQASAPVLLSCLTEKENRVCCCTQGMDFFFLKRRGKKRWLLPIRCRCSLVFIPPSPQSSFLSSGSWPVAPKPLIQQRQKSRRRSFIENMAGCFGRTGAALLSADPAAKARVSLLITETSPRLLL